MDFPSLLCHSSPLCDGAQAALSSLTQHLACSLITTRCCSLQTHPSVHLSSPVLCRGPEVSISATLLPPSAALAHSPLRMKVVKQGKMSFL